MNLVLGIQDYGHYFSELLFGTIPIEKVVARKVYRKLSCVRDR